MGEEGGCAGGWRRHSGPGRGLGLGGLLAMEVGYVAMAMWLCGDGYSREGPDLHYYSYCDGYSSCSRTESLDKTDFSHRA